MVQGLSSLYPLYTLFPRHRQEAVMNVVPSAAIYVHPRLLQAYRETATNTTGVPKPRTVDHIRHASWRIEAVLAHAEYDTWF